MSRIELTVGGMTCMGCVKNATEALKKIDGVGEVEVTLEPGEAKIEVKPGGPDVETLIGALEDVGFDAALKA